MSCTKSEDILKKWDVGHAKFRIEPSTVEDIGLDDYIKHIFDIFDQIFKSGGYVNEVTAFELRKFTWIKGDDHSIELLMNHYGTELHISIN